MSDLVERTCCKEAALEELHEAVVADNERLTALLAEREKEIERLRDALKTVGDDYPGSSCQRWCYQQAGLEPPE